MWQLQARQSLDKIIDSCLDLQEGILRLSLTSEKEFSTKLKAILPPSSKTEASQMPQDFQEFINSGFNDLYRLQTDHFKSTVSATNSLMPFYITLIAKERSSKQNLARLHDLLTGVSANFCNECGYDGGKSTLDNHKCNGMSERKNWYLSKALLTLDKKNFYCQLGCGKFGGVKSMVMHLREMHTDEELWVWKIKKLCLN
jgi:hypothetical protein